MSKLKYYENRLGQNKRNEEYGPDLHPSSSQNGQPKWSSGLCWLWPDLQLNFNGTKHDLFPGVCSKNINNHICNGCKEWCYVEADNDYGSK